jgi:hypothetical protein
VVEVGYRDTAPAPVLCEGFGALGRYFGRTELAFTAGAPLALDVVTVRDVKLPEEQARWEAETRRWIRQVQSRRVLEPPVKPGDAASLKWAGAETR